MKRTVTLVIVICAAAAISLAADAAAGKAVFDKSCKSCHGALMAAEIPVSRK